MEWSLESLLESILEWFFKNGRGGTSGFFCPSEFSSPHFYEYTNDEPLKTNFRFIDPTPSPQKRTRLKINHILVQFLHRDLFFS
jgi:hypothetical protein